MGETFALMQQVEPWHWFALGLILLIAEILTGTTYLLWPAAAAAITGVFALFGPGEVMVEWVVFAILTIALTLAGHFYIRRRWLTPHTPGDINERATTLIGQAGLADGAFVAGHGSVRLNDTIWRAASAEPIAPGDRVEVVAVEGTTLQVKRAI
jgi:membrane protein implicated in regulation of membrane protease activity